MLLMYTYWNFYFNIRSEETLLYKCMSINWHFAHNMLEINCEKDKFI